MSILHYKSLKFISLGVSNSGKTYWLGSMNRLKYETGPNNFTFKGSDFRTVDMIEEVYNTMAGVKSGYIGTTPKMNVAKIVFQKQLHDLFQIELTDIFGQTTEATKVENNKDEVNKLLATLPEQDGILIFIKCPSSEAEFDEARGQLSRHLNLAQLVLKSRKPVPIALVITQIDKLTLLTDIETDIQCEIDAHISQARYDQNLSEEELAAQKKFVRADIVNPIVKRAISPYVYELADIFSNRLKGFNVAKRVFPTSSIGFDNAQPNPAATSIAVAKSKRLYPYGTIPSFLWMVYAYGRLNQGWADGIRHYHENELLDDINDYFSRGQAYDDSQSRLFNVRYIADTKM